MFVEPQFFHYHIRVVVQKWTPIAWRKLWYFPNLYSKVIKYIHYDPMSTTQIPKRVYRANQTIQCDQKYRRKTYSATEYHQKSRNYTDEFNLHEEVEQNSTEGVCEFLRCWWVNAPPALLPIGQWTYLLITGCRLPKSISKFQEIKFLGFSLYSTLETFLETQLNRIGRFYTI